MPATPRTPLAELRALCVEHGIYVISHLDTLDKIEPGMSQVELSERSGLSTSGVNQIINMLVLNELVVCDAGEGQGKPSKLSHTPRGKAFLSRVRSALSYPAPNSTSPSP